MEFGAPLSAARGGLCGCERRASGRKAAPQASTARPVGPAECQVSPAYLLRHRPSPRSECPPWSAVFASFLRFRFSACRCGSARSQPELRTPGCAFAHCDRNSVTNGLFFDARADTSSLGSKLRLNEQRAPRWTAVRHQPNESNREGENIREVWCNK